MQKAGKSYLIALFVALVMYVIGVTYQLATIEKRLGEVEHSLICDIRH